MFVPGGKRGLLKICAKGLHEDISLCSLCMVSHNVNECEREGERIGGLVLCGRHKR